MKVSKTPVLFISFLIFLGILQANTQILAANPEDSATREKVEQMSDGGQDAAPQTAGQNEDNSPTARDKEKSQESPPENGNVEEPEAGNSTLSLPLDKSELENWDPEKEPDEAGKGTSETSADEAKKETRHESPVMRIIEKSTRSLIEKRGGSTPPRPMTKEEIETDLIEIFIEEGIKISLILILMVVAITTANVIAKNTIKLARARS
ncbi:MAG TPA: hypothetical protein PKC98_20400 [Candidatus Melainabacteria bacterium]|nr:hypothetical protein [Candidatus Melainabacteria bacterium]